jgi:TonB-linked SusC/RagA family outer membrane protein
MKNKLLSIIKCLFIVVLLLIYASAFSQSATITGSVLDSENKPIIGTNVLVVGTTIGTVTDIAGNYSLEIPVGEVEIAFSFMGYLTENQKLNILEGESRVIDIVLIEDLMQLDDVVVIGYGTQKKSDLTGAVSSVSSEELLKSPTVNLEQALQGRVSGVQVTQATGAPGAETRLRVRGVITFGDAAPLYIIDGVPGGSRDVNPADIESMEILKDASTSAIYGADGANGVVLITTKKGKSGKTEVNFNTYHGFQSIYKSIDMADGLQMANYTNEAEIISGIPEDRRTFANQSEINSLPSFDHQKDMLQNSRLHSYDLSLSSGSEKSSNYFSIGYFNQDGIVKNTSYEKINIRLNSDFKVKDWINVGQNISFYMQDTKGFNEWQLKNEYHTPFMHAAAFIPYDTSTYIDDNGELQYTGDLFGNNNALATIDYLSHNRWQNYNGKASFWMRIFPVKGVVYESRLTGNLGFTDTKHFTPEYKVRNTTQDNGRTVIERQMDKNLSWNFQNILTYSTTVLDMFNVSIMGGIESGYSRYQYMGGKRYDLISDAEEMHYFDASLEPDSTQLAPFGTAHETAGFAYFGRINLDYKSKYLFQANIRRDGSSLFGPEQRYGIFPSFSAGWKFSEEDFGKNLTWLSFGKLRYGWGKSGANNISPYDYYSTILTNENFDAIFSSSNGILIGAAPNKLVNKRISWETVVTSSLGLDLTFINNRLGFSFDYFSRKNVGMLMQVPVPDIAGWKIEQEFQEGGSPTAYSNSGSLKNSGYEVTVSWKDVVTQKFSYDISANLTYQLNEVVDVGGDTLFHNDAKVRGIGGFLTRTFEGGGIGDFLGYQVDRIFQESDGYYDETSEKWIITNQPSYQDSEGNTQYAQPRARPGDYKWKDLNNDGQIDKKDLSVIGNPFPKYMVGLNTYFKYGIVDLTMFWQGAFGFEIMNATYGFLIGQGANGNMNLPADFVEDHWRPANDGYSYPAVTDAKWARYDPYNENNNYSTFSDVYVEKGNYMRLKNLQIGITLPENWVSKLKVQNLRVYVGFDNLLTITKYSGMDPEIDSRNPLLAGLDKAIYPSARTTQLGLNLKF